MFDVRRVEHTHTQALYLVNCVSLCDSCLSLSPHSFGSFVMNFFFHIFFFYIFYLLSFVRDPSKMHNNNNSNRQVVTLLPRGACHFVWFFFSFYSLNLLSADFMKENTHSHSYTHTQARPCLPSISSKSVGHCFHSLHYILYYYYLFASVLHAYVSYMKAMYTREPLQIGAMVIKCSSDAAQPTRSRIIWLWIWQIFRLGGVDPFETMRTRPIHIDTH